ncbi:hypothetical protein CFAM422_007664 [Trichoderma lentiforme]|uniref:Uncharacterized protein n=1 Tax=Trichoderma lentiforme TaxID=1567552 RepID=A0A9P4XB96_9HYPO|nr:hypothetical protein CFAM422_007664 [Trichoderma lentiforme]
MVQTFAIALPLRGHRADALNADSVWKSGNVERLSVQILDWYEEDEEEEEGEEKSLVLCIFSVFEAKRRRKRKIEGENEEQGGRLKNRRTREETEEEDEDAGTGRWAERILNKSGVGSTFEDDERDDEDYRSDDEAVGWQNWGAV